MYVVCKKAFELHAYRRMYASIYMYIYIRTHMVYSRVTVAQPVATGLHPTHMIACICVYIYIYIYIYIYMYIYIYVVMQASHTSVLSHTNKHTLA